MDFGMIVLVIVTGVVLGPFWLIMWLLGTIRIALFGPPKNTEFRHPGGIYGND